MLVARVRCNYVRPIRRLSSYVLCAILVVRILTVNRASSTIGTLVVVRVLHVVTVRHLFRCLLSRAVVFVHVPVLSVSHAFEIVHKVRVRPTRDIPKLPPVLGMLLPVGIMHCPHPAISFAVFWLARICKAQRLTHDDDDDDDDVVVVVVMDCEVCLRKMKLFGCLEVLEDCEHILQNYLIYRCRSPLWTASVVNHWEDRAHALMA